MNPSTLVDPAFADALARCLAKMDGQFISAEEWMGDQVYAQRAQEVIRTIRKFEAGHRSGGLPSTQPREIRVLVVGDPVVIPDVSEIGVYQPISSHFTKAQAETAQSRYTVSPPLGLSCNCHKFEVKPTNGRFRRWEVRAVPKHTTKEET